MTHSPALLTVEKLSKSYRRRPVLREVTLQVGPGEAVAVIGPNGAGKSTFLGCLTGERLPDSGRIQICGADPFADPAAAARCMGFVPEHTFLYGELTVSEMLRFVAEVRGLPAEPTAEEAERLLQILGLAGAEGTLCRELSQGMARKVAVIAALLHGPAVLILDEVFNGLDEPSTRRLLEELGARRSAGTSLLLSSHDLALLANWCDRGLLLATEGWRDLRHDAWEAWSAAPSLALGPAA